LIPLGMASGDDACRGLPAFDAICKRRKPKDPGRNLPEVRLLVDCCKLPASLERGLEKMMKLRCLIATSFCALLIGAATAESSTITSGWYQGVTVSGSGSPQTVVTNGPSTVTTQELAISRVHQPFPAVPAAVLDASALLRGDATADTLHAVVQSAVNVVNNPGNGNLGGHAFSNFGFIIRDELTFRSDTLATGTPVAFQLTATLHSVLGATSAGNCSSPIGAGYSPTGQAQLVTTLIGGGFPPLYDTLIHDTCGRGADLMTATTVNLLATVDGTVEFQTLLELFSSAALLVNHDATATTTVDAGSTANLYIQVLTPGVTFAAASGASYTAPTAVPESGTIVWLTAGLVVVSGLRKALSARCSV
jgi:hypothetical protein